MSKFNVEETIDERQPLLDEFSNQTDGLFSNNNNPTTNKSLFTRSQAISSLASNSITSPSISATAATTTTTTTAQTSFLFNRNIQITNSSDPSSPNHSKYFSLYKLWKFTGPGLLISVAYLDPGNLESDLQAGALTGYKLLWVLLLSTLAGFFIQILSVKLGSVTGFHLAEICYREYGKFMRLFLWIMIEVAIIASDIQQVIGCAVALNLISQGLIPIWVAILITSCDVFVFLLLESTGIRVIEAIFASAIAVMAGAFLYIYIRVKPDQLSIIEGVLEPWCKNCTNIDVKQLIGIVGSIVMPHNIFFHSTLVLSRNFDRRSESAVKEANKYYMIELGCALFVAFICNLFVTSVSAKAFFQTPQAANITLYNAGLYMNDEYGLAMKIIWAIGLLSAGQCSTISGTYAGQFIMEGFTKWNLKRWKRIIITRSISIIPCTLVALLTYSTIDELNFWCNIVQSIQLPFALLPILHFTSSKRIMGSFRNNLLLKSVCYLISLAVISMNIYFVISLIIERGKWWFWVLGALLLFYLIFIFFFLLGVNSIYRIKLFFRSIFCQYNAEELDELLHADPVYRRPQRNARLTQVSHSSPAVYSSFSASLPRVSSQTNKNWKHKNGSKAKSQQCEQAQQTNDFYTPPIIA